MRLSGSFGEKSYFPDSNSEPWRVERARLARQSWASLCLRKSDSRAQLTVWPGRRVTGIVENWLRAHTQKGDYFQKELGICPWNCQLLGDLALSNACFRRRMTNKQGVRRKERRRDRYLSESRKGQVSGTGGVRGRSLARAMMCSNVMSVCVLAFMSWTSGTMPYVGRLRGVRLNTCTTMGSLAVRKASTASSWVAFERSLPLTYEDTRAVCVLE